MSTAPTQPNHSDESTLLGRMAVRRGLITSRQLEECLAELDQLERQGLSPHLGQILVRRNLIDAKMLAQLLRAQAREELSLESIGRYRVVEEIGEGGMARVFRAFDGAIGRLVAVKLLHSPLDEESRERMRREARILARLSNPNVVRVFELGEERGRLFLVMELVTGGALNDAIEKGTSLRRLVRWLEQAARGVHRAHEAGVLHRDLKPANILLTEAGTAKVGDFGLAHAHDAPDSLTPSMMVVGTMSYMAPEQLERDPSELDRRTDVFGLGGILHTIATGAPPHEGDSVPEICDRILRHDPPPIRSLAPNAPEELERIARRAMARAAEDRHATAAEFADDLCRFLDGQERPAPGPKSRRRVVLAAAIAGIVAVLGFEWARWSASAPDGSGGKGSEPPTDLAYEEACSSVEASLERALVPAPLEESWAADLAARRDALRDLATRRPESTEAWLLLGRAEDRLGRSREALECFRRAAAAEPPTALAALELAWRLVATVRYARSYEPLAAAGSRRRDVDDSAAEAALLLHRARKGASGREVELVEALVSVLRNASFSLPPDGAPEGPLATAHAWALGTGAASQAERLAALDRGIALDPLDPRLRLRRASERFATEDLAGSALDLVEVRSPSAEAVWARLLAGRLALLEGIPARAVAECTAALEASPSSATAWFDRAVARSMAGEPELAVTDGERACELEPGSAAAHSLLAILRMRLGQRPPAAAEARAALEAVPEDALASRLRTLAEGPEDPPGTELERALATLLASVQDGASLMAWSHVLFERRSYVLALAGFERLAQENPGVPGYHIFQAWIHGDRNEVDLALECLDRATALDRSGAARTHAIRAGILFRSGRHAEAIAAYDAHLARWPGDAAALLQRGLLRLSTGDLEGARQDADAVLVDDPRSVLALKCRGQISQRLGDQQEARSWFARALEACPEGSPVRVEIERALASSKADRDR